MKVRIVKPGAIDIFARVYDRSIDSDIVKDCFLKSATIEFDIDGMAMSWIKENFRDYATKINYKSFSEYLQENYDGKL